MPVDVPFTIIVIKAIQSSSSSDNCVTTMIPLIIIIVVVIAWDHRDINYRPHKMSCAMKHSYQIIRIVTDWEPHVKGEQNGEFSHVIWRCIDFYFSTLHLAGGGSGTKEVKGQGCAIRLQWHFCREVKRISEEILALVTYKDKKQELCFFSHEPGTSTKTNRFKKAGAWYFTVVL